HGSRECETSRQIARTVETRIADETLPPNDRARLLEISPHHDEQMLAGSIGDLLEALGVFVSSVRIVDRAGTDHDQQAMPVPSVNEVTNRIAARDDERAHLFGRRKFRLEIARRRKWTDFDDAAVLDLHGVFLWAAGSEANAWAKKKP